MSDEKKGAPGPTMRRRAVVRGGDEVGFEGRLYHSDEATPAEIAGWYIEVGHGHEDVRVADIKGATKDELRAFDSLMQKAAASLS